MFYMYNCLIGGVMEIFLLYLIIICVMILFLIVYLICWEL